MSNDDNLSVYNLDEFEDDSVESENDSEYNQTNRNCQLNNFKLNKSKMSTLTQRLGSAKKNKINELQNKVDELKQKLNEKETENRLLKKVQARQEKELSKFENSKADIPNLFQYHSEEVRILQNRLKQVKEKFSDTELKLKTKDTQLQNIKKELQRLQKIVSDNELIEKESLKQMVKSLKLDLEEKEAANQVLTKKLELLTKTHRQELASEAGRHKETYRKLKAIEQSYEKLEINYNELRKIKDKQNIYTMSMARASSRVMRVNTNTYPKEDSVVSSKSDAKMTPDYSLSSSQGSSPPSPSSLSSISPKKSPPHDNEYTSPAKLKHNHNLEEIEAGKRESLLAKLRAIEKTNPKVAEDKTTSEPPIFVKRSPQKMENGRNTHHTMPEVSVNTETLLNPRRTSARRKSSLSVSSNENLLLDMQKPFTVEKVATGVTGQDNKRKSDLMISLFGKPSIQHDDNDSILDLNSELNVSKKSNRIRGSEAIF